MTPTKPRCPICGTEVDFTASEARPHRPFCSNRCKLVDLDRWLSGDYRIPGPYLDPEDPRLAEAASRGAGGDADTDPDSAIRDEQGT